MLGLSSCLSADYKAVFNNEMSVLLDGTNDYIELDGLASVDGWDSISNAGSISIWVKINETSSTGQIIRMQADSNNFISIYYHASSNTTRTAYKGGGGTTIAKSSAAIEEDGEWHHVVSTWSTTTNKLTLYLDGTIVEAKPNSGPLDEFSGDISTIDVGQNTSGSSYFDGYVDELSVWNAALTGAQISTIYNNGVPNDIMTLNELTPSVRCVGYYRFEDDTSNTVKDHSAYINNGTLVNGPDYTTDAP
tara:strand:- start:498 stop:1241 length:744 start_codon:yes stop_codon:yes gene_type:complete